jgi:hypothetical protein
MYAFVRPAQHAIANKDKRMCISWFMCTSVIQVEIPSHLPVSHRDIFSAYSDTRRPPISVPVLERPGEGHRARVTGSESQTSSTVTATPRRKHDE